MESLYTDKEYDEAKKKWETFKYNIINKNRFFSGKTIIKDLDVITKECIEIDNSTYKGSIDFYRARIGDFKNAPNKELLAPPNYLAKEGRCNPEWISYLYLCSDIETAISEVKPSEGELVTVARIEINDNCKFFKFNVNDVQEGKYRALINVIDEDLSQVITANEKMSYIPFQFISEYIKNKGYSGFIYSSAVGDGLNYLIYEPKDIQVISRELFHIKEVKYYFEKI